MTLSPEDRDKIYEEEKARSEAQDRIMQEKAQEQAQVKKALARKNGKRMAIAVGIFSAVVGLLSLLPEPREKQSLHQKQSMTRDVSTLKTGRAVCVSKALLEEFAAHQQDVQAVERLLQSGCLFTKGAMLVSVLAVEPSGIAKVRVFTGKKQDVELWTTFESLQDQK